jgi:DDE domain
VPEFEKRWNRFSKAVGTSWRVDETYISIKAKWHYLYRAVDKQGKTTARSNDDARRWPGSSRSRTRPPRSPASISLTAFVTDSSRLGVGAVAVIGRERPNGRWRSHRTGCEKMKPHHEQNIPLMHPNPISLYMEN